MAAGALVLLWVVGSAPCWSSTQAGLSGRVIDAATREPIPGANVVVLGTVLGATTDQRGEFRISGLPAGLYTVRVSLIGYRPRKLEGVRVLLGESTALEVELEQVAIEAAPIVVTASKKRQAAQDAPVSISTIEKTELEQRDVASLDGALRHSLGVEFKTTEVGIRASTGYTHGAGSRVLFLIDGTPATTGDTGGINWDALPPTEVESIEIVKGAGSALYGSSALGGVINVITRSPSEVPQTRARASVGAYSKPYYEQWEWSSRRRLFHGLDLSHSRQIGFAGLLVSGGRKVSDGYRQNGEYKRNHVLGKLNLDVSERSKLTLLLRWAEERRGEMLQWKGQSQALSVADVALGDQVYSRKLNAYASFSHIAQANRALVAKAYSYATHWKNHFHDNQDDARARRLGCEARMEWLATTHHSLTLGTEAIHNRVISEFFGDHDTFDLAGYLQDEIGASPSVSATLGARYDIHWVDGGTPDRQFSPKLGMVYRPGEATSLRAHVAKGFRAPSVAEQFTETRVSGYRVIPNPDLQAERGWSLELGLNQILSEHFWLDVAAFQNEYWDMIEPDTTKVNAETAFQFANTTRARIQGFEAVLKFGLLSRMLTGSLGYTYVYPRKGRIAHERDLQVLEAFETLEDQEPLAYRSRHRFLCTASVHYRSVTLGGDFRYASRVEQVKVYPNEDRVPEYVVDLRAALDLGKVRLLAKVENLLQYHYTEVERNLAPIRSFALTLSSTI